MPRRMRNATPMGLGLRTLQPSAAAMPTGWRSTLSSYGQQYGQHVIPGLLSLLQGGLSAYNVQNPQQQAPIPQVPQMQQPVVPEQTAGAPATIAPEMQQETEEAPQMRLSDLLSHLISSRVDAMSGMMPSYPDRLFSQAFEASNSQLGSPQGPPRYQPTGPQFAFDQTLGGGASFSPLSALGDFSTPQASVPKEWWKTGANQLGGLLQGLSPMAGSLGGLPGILGGAGLSGLGYALRQI